MEPFLDFYREHSVAPVRYQVDEDFFYRRIWLYSRLGVPPICVRDNTVLEFGPGTGDNARVVASLSPSRYVLVEANPSSYSFTTQAVGDGKFDFVEIVQSRIQDFSLSEKFGLVIAENSIPGQRESVNFAKKILDFVQPGGSAILTTVTEAGLVADMCRQLFAPEIRRRVSGSSSEDEKGSFKQQVDLGVAIFSEHLTSLGPFTRSTADWVIDNVLHDWLDRKRTFTPRDALASLSPDFDFLSSSPNFMADTRWFKQVSRGSTKSIALFIEELDSNIPALLDYRVPIGTRMEAPAEALSTLDSLFNIRDSILAAGSYARLPEFLDGLKHLSSLLPEESGLTRDAIREYTDSRDGILGFIGGGAPPNWPNFSKWWGRATLYLSLWRLPERSA